MTTLDDIAARDGFDGPDARGDRTEAHEQASADRRYLLTLVREAREGVAKLIDLAYSLDAALDQEYRISTDPPCLNEAEIAGFTPLLQRLTEGSDRT